MTMGFLGSISAIMMKRNSTIAITGVFLLLAVNPAVAGQRIDREEICPIGGEKFVRADTISCFISGNKRFDLKSDTSCDWVKWPVICPSNGFPIYKEDFSPEEVKRLGAIVEGKGFQKARIGNVPSFMFYHLMKTLGENDAVLADALLPAIWDTTIENNEGLIELILPETGEAFRRYEDNTVKFSERLPVYLELAIDHNKRALSSMEKHDQDWFKRQILAANFERRLGRFKAATKRLDDLSEDELAPDDYTHQVLEALRQHVLNSDTKPQWLP
jgi:hypothetical protein